MLTTKSEVGISLCFTAKIKKMNAIFGIFMES